MTVAQADSCIELWSVTVAQADNCIELRSVTVAQTTVLSQVQWVNYLVEHNNLTTALNLVANNYATQLS